MPDFNGTFGITLKAFTDLDRSSLQRAEKAVGESFGRASSGQTKGAQAAKTVVTEGANQSTRFGLSIKNIRESLNATWHTSGLGKAVDQFRDAKEAAREFHDQAEKTGKLFGTVGGGIFGLAGLGGIGAALQGFGANSMSLRNTAGTFGVGTGMLQGFRGGAGLAGLNEGAADTAIGQLQKNLFAAKWGLPEGTQALGAANILGLNVREDPEAFLKHLADKIKGQKDPQVQGEIAKSFGVEELLPWLRRGSAAIDDLNEATKRHNFLSEEQIEQGDRLGVAYRGAEQSISGMANAISAELSPALTPMLTSFSTWLDEMKQSPSEMKTLTAGVEVLSVALGVTLVSAFAKLTAAATSWWALPAIRFLFQTGAGALAGDVGAALGVFFGGWLGGGHISGEEDQPAFKKYMQEHGKPAPGAQPGAPGGGRQGSAAPAGAPLGTASSPGAATLTSLGIQQGSPEWQIAMRESRGNPNLGWAGLPGSPDYSPGGTDLTNTPLDANGFPMWGGKMGPRGNSTAAGLWMITKTNWENWAPRLGIHDFSPQSQFRVMTAMRDANRGYGDWNASGPNFAYDPTTAVRPPTQQASAAAAGASAPAAPPPSVSSGIGAGAPAAPPTSMASGVGTTPPAMPQPVQLAAATQPDAAVIAGHKWGYTPKTAASDAAPPTPAEADKLDPEAYRAHLADIAKERGNLGPIPPGLHHNSAGQPYELNMTDQEKANQDQSYAYVKAHRTHWLDDYRPAESADTAHHVVVDVNGPAGTNASIKSAKGPAELTLRTQTAFSSP